MYRILLIIFLYISSNSFCIGINNDSLENLSSPFLFQENKGQWNPSVLFKSHFKGGNLWIEENRILFHIQDFSYLHSHHASIKSHSSEKEKFKQHLVAFSFLGNNKLTEVLKNKKSEFYTNFFIGSDRSKWSQNVHSYSDITLKNYYTGIDLHYNVTDEETKYEFFVHPSISPELIQFNILGSKSISINRIGDLIVETPLGTIAEKKPIAYQLIAGKKIDRSVSFKLNQNTISYEVGYYDKNFTLIIDPILVFATYSGSETDNFGMTATYAYDGSAYSGGTIFGNKYPIPDSSVFDFTSNLTDTDIIGASSDIFISKYSSDGNKMIWTNIIGGGSDHEGAETIHSLICDSSNNIYAFGATSSKNFPTSPGCFQNSNKGGDKFNAVFNGAQFGEEGIDIFCLKISSNGKQLLGSTYIGGSGNDGINANITGVKNDYNKTTYYDSLTSNYGDQFRGEIMLDAENNILIATSTRSKDFPTKTAVQNQNNGEQDGVIFKLKNDFSDLLFSTYIGGSNNDALYSVKIDSSYNIVFCGGTSSTNLATTGAAYQSAYGGGKADGFIGKLSANGTVLSNMTYLGLNKYDQVFIVEVDASDNIYVIGHSLGGLFPIKNATFSNPGSSQFIAKLSPDLSTILNSTVYGNGTSTETNISPAAFLVDNCGNIYVSGWGANILQANGLYGMPVSSNAFQKTSPNGFDFHLVVINNSFSNLLYGSYIGGEISDEHVDGGTSRFDKHGVIYQSVCGGCGGNSDFPTSPKAYSSENKSKNCNNLLFKFDFELIPSAKIELVKDTTCLPARITFTNQSSSFDNFIWNFGNGEIDSTHSEIVKQYFKTGTYTVDLAVKNNRCNFYDHKKILITIVDSIQLKIPKIIEQCTPNPVSITALSNESAKTFLWSFHRNFSDTLKFSKDSTLTLFPSNDKTIYIQTKNGICIKEDSILIHFISPTLSLKGPTQLCFNQIDTVTANFKSYLETFTYNWNPKINILKNISKDTILFKGDKSCYISLNLNGNLGCNLKDSIKITIKDTLPKSNFSFKLDTTCIPFSIFIKNNSSNYNSFKWILNKQIIDSSSQNLHLHFTKPGLQNIQLIAQNNKCFYSDSTESSITLIDNVTLPLITPIELCKSELTKLTTLKKNTNTVIIWSLSPNFSDTLSYSKDSVFNYLIDKSNTLYRKSINGSCSDFDSVPIKIIKESFKITGKKIICFDEKDTLTAHITSKNQTFKYEWGPKKDTQLKINDSTVIVRPWEKQYITLNVIGNLGCNLTDSIFVTLKDSLFIKPISPIELCSPSPLKLITETNNSASKFIWSLNPLLKDTLYTSLDSVFVFTPIKKTTIYRYASNGYCATLDSVNISLIKESFLLKGDTSICKDEESLISASLNSQFQTFEKKWSPTSIVFKEITPLNVLVKPLTTQYLTFIAIGSKGCILKDSIKLYVKDSIVLSLLPEYELCHPMQLSINPIKTSGASEILWSSNSLFKDTLSTTNSYSNYFKKDGLFYLKLSNGFCEKMDSTQLKIIKNSLKIKVDSSICFNSTDTLSISLTSNNQSFKYTLSPLESTTQQLSQSTFLLKPTQTKTHYLTATGSQGCIIKDSVKIKVNGVKLKSVKLTIADTIVLIGSTIKINASPSDLNYKWTATTNFNQISPSSIESKIDKTSTYYVVVENENCSTKDSISISPYDWLCEFPYVFVPNAFSPNNDNQNDVLYVKGRPISSILLRIYDRWGELVFESTSLNDGWDGTYKEKALPPDVYDYYLLVTCINGVKNKIQGNITLLR